MIEDVGFMILLLRTPPRSKARRLELLVTLDEIKLRGQTTMRCNFTTELKVDIDVTDEALKKAFIDLILMKAREAFGVAGMLAKQSPQIVVSFTTRDGKQTLPVFDAPLRDADDDSGE